MEWSRCALCRARSLRLPLSQTNAAKATPSARTTPMIVLRCFFILSPFGLEPVAERPRSEAARFRYAGETRTLQPRPAKGRVRSLGLRRGDAPEVSSPIEERQGEEIMPRRKRADRSPPPSQLVEVRHVV